ncbi:hypothetical protein ALC57_00464 [Trachymyrmex cornetzi]|uniref:Uncharacterized protein n=1 Tax=Trachymyrmex cornetzi TaxID=471704 RepID=A0A151JRR7_9HYME|nr:hypothetical protein ALC57_00464 [Trachymyrmex cornetzi]
MKEQSSSKFSEAAISSFVLDIGTEGTDPSLAGETAVSQPEVSEQADEQTVLQNRGGEPEHHASSKVSFDLQSTPEIPQDSNKENDASLARDLFGEQPATTGSPWNAVILESTRNEVRSGLKEDLRSFLLSKFDLKGNLTKLGLPKLNVELRSALAKHHSVLKRDEYQMKMQQVGACLNAFGSGMSNLLKAYQNQTLQTDIRDAISKLAEGIHLLADHQFRLSLARQSVIKPYLTYVGKSAADVSLVDEWLFGSSFAEGLKSAQACEKAGKELSRYSLGPNSSTRARFQPTQQQPLKQLPIQKGNLNAPVRKVATSTRSSGDIQKSSHSQSSRRRSHSRTRSHR